MAKGEAADGKDAATGSLADAYGEWASSMSAAGVSGMDGRNASASEGKASGGKSATGGAPTASSVGRSGPSSADVGKGSVSVGAKGMGGEGPSGMPAIGAPSVGRSATMGGPSITGSSEGRPGIMSAAGLSVMSSPRQAEDRSIASLAAARGLYGGQATARQAQDRSMIGLSRDSSDLEQMILGAELVSARFGGSISPEDVLTIISYETGGTLGKNQIGPTTKWGQHEGLIQWGEPQREKYGITRDMSVADQMSKVGDYLYDFGFRSGMGVDRAYAAINAGGVTDAHLGRKDEAAGGAPGTVAEKVANQMGGHRDQARSILDGTFYNSRSPLSGDMNRLTGRDSPDRRGMLPEYGRNLTDFPNGPGSRTTVALPANGPIPASAPADRPGGLMPSNVSWEQDRRGLAVLAPPTGSPWDGLSPAAQQALSMLSTQRDQVALTSASRSAEGNRDAKGTRDSEHLTGNAFDISLRDMTDQEKSLVVEQAIMSGATRVGTYGVTDPSHVPVLHVDFADTGKAGVHAMFDGSSRNVDKAPGWFTAGLSQVTSPQPSARPDSTAPATGGFGRFMGDAAQFGPSPRSLEGPGGIYLDAPPAQQPNMTVPPQGFSGGQTPRGQEQAADASTPAEAFSGRSRGAGGPMTLEELFDASGGASARPAAPEQREVQPERAATAQIDPEREARRERNADRIDKALPWVAGPIAGKINEARREAGKTTMGGWLVDLFGDSQGGAPIIVENSGGEGTSAAGGTPVAPPPAYQPGSWLYGIFDEPKRPTPAEKWGR